MSRPTALDLPENVSAHRLETARGSFAVLDASPAPGAPPYGTALLVPGFTGSKEDFLPLLAPLSAAGFRVVSVDGRGQYESGGPREESAYARGELAADVVAQTAAVTSDGGGPPHLLGHSLGGLIVRDAVITHGPRAWASLTLMSSGPAAISEEQSARTRLLLDTLPVMDLEAIWQAMRSMDADNSELPDTPPAVERFLHRRWVTTLPEQLAVTARQLMEEPDRVDELAAAGRLPKLVLSGEVDHAWPVPWLDAMAARLGAERVVVKGAEHSPNTERPDETAAALIAFWTGVTRSLTDE
jgi:pimeloyl-ACP methyl ester carboxylesterase